MMANEVVFVKVVRGKVLEDFESECLEIIQEQQEKGRAVKINYQPIALTNVVGSVQKAELLYTAMIEARQL